MTRTFCGAAAVLLAVASVRAADEGKYTAKLATTPPPKELAGPVREVLSDHSVQVFDAKGELFAEVWFRKELPVKATPEQVEKGLRYGQVPETTLVGAIRLPRGWSDYRRQKVKPGVYTLRFARQPMDGDHMGTAPYNEFCLLSPAAEDTKPGLMDVKALHELSPKAAGTSHPTVMMLVPVPKPPEKPMLVSKPSDHQVLTWKVDAAASGARGVLGIGLTLIGHTMAE